MFREQALAALRRPAYGSVHVRIPRRDSAAAVASIALAVAFLAFCAFGKITRKANVAGVLAHAAGTVTVRAREAGQVADVRTQEGSHAKAGDVLLVIGTERLALTEDGATVVTADRSAASIQSRADHLSAERTARVRYYELRMRAAADRVASIARQITHARAESDSLQQRAALARSAWHRYDQLASSGFVSRAQGQQHEEDALDAASRVEAARRTIASLLSDRAAAAAEIETLREQMQGELAEIDRTIESTREEAQQNSAHRKMAVAAPADGVVSTLKLSPGQAVQQGELLFDFLPDARGNSSRSQVQLFASSRTVGFVKPGQPVNLRFDAFPFQKFGLFKGRVASVSRTPYAPAEIPASVPAANEPMYRVLVDVDAAAPGAPQLVFRPGMVVNADVLLETRAIWEWVLEPLIAIHKKF